MYVCFLRKLGGPGATCDHGLFRAVPAAVDPEECVRGCHVRAVPGAGAHPSVNNCVPSPDDCDRVILCEASEPIGPASREEDRLRATEGEMRQEWCEAQCD